MPNCSIVTTRNEFDPPCVTRKLCETRHRKEPLVNILESKPSEHQILQTRLAKMSTAATERIRILIRLFRGPAS